jgi:predicted metalloendopeptidase
VRLRPALGLCTLVIASVGATQSALKSGIDLNALDRSVRPQNDLYRFVNGGWIDKAEIPADRVYEDAFTDLGDKTELDLLAIVDEARASQRPSRALRQIADLYASLMNEARLEELGTTPIDPARRRTRSCCRRRSFSLRSSTPTRTRPPTTAASARSSATSSCMDSTTSSVFASGGGGWSTSSTGTVRSPECTSTVS